MFNRKHTTIRTMATIPGAPGGGSTPATSDSFPPEVDFNCEANSINPFGRRITMPDVSTESNHSS